MPLHPSPAAASTAVPAFLDQVLRPLHAAWLARARSALDAAADPGADSWDRWMAMQYLSNGFREHYRLERRLMEELGPRLTADATPRLAVEGERLVRFRMELDRLGRRQAAAPDWMPTARALLDQLVVWLGEIELAARAVPARPLPPGAAETLIQLESSTDRRRRARASPAW